MVFVCPCCIRRTCPAQSTTAKARGTIWVLGRCRLCLRAYIVLWWVLCQWLSHRARAVMALPAWPCCRREGKKKAVNAPLPRDIDGAIRGAPCCRGRWCVFSVLWGSVVDFRKRQRGAPTAAGSAGGLASCCRGRWCVLTIGGIEPPLLGNESILLTSGPVQASCTV